MARADVLIVSLGGTAGLREADAELAASLRRAGARVEVATTVRPPELRTYAALELAWALNARRAAILGIREHHPHAVLYSSTTAALLGPVPGAIRFDAPAAGNRPGRHGIWQRPVEARRMQGRAAARAVERGRPGRGADAARGRRDRPVPGRCERPARAQGHRRHHLRREPGEEGPGPRARRVGARRARRARSSSWRASTRRRAARGWRGPSDRGARGGAGRVRFTGMVPRDEYRALLRRARVFVTAPRREDYGIAQLEALADGCQLVTNEAPGPYAALPLARALDPRLVGDGLDIRTALDDPRPGGRGGGRAVHDAPPSTGSWLRSSCRACAASRTPATAACWPPDRPTATRAGRSRRRT